MIVVVAATTVVVQNPNLLLYLYYRIPSLRLLKRRCSIFPFLMIIAFLILSSQFHLYYCTIAKRTERRNDTITMQSRSRNRNEDELNPFCRLCSDPHSDASIHHAWCTHNPNRDKERCDVLLHRMKHGSTTLGCDACNFEYFSGRRIITTSKKKKQNGTTVNAIGHNEACIFYQKQLTKKKKARARKLKQQQRQRRDHDDDDDDDDDDDNDDDDDDDGSIFEPTRRKHNRHRRIQAFTFSAHNHNNNNNKRPFASSSSHRQAGGRKVASSSSSSSSSRRMEGRRNKEEMQKKLRHVTPDDTTKKSANSANYYNSNYNNKQRHRRCHSSVTIGSNSNNNNNKLMWTPVSAKDEDPWGETGWQIEDNSLYGPQSQHQQRATTNRYYTMEPFRVMESEPAYRKSHRLPEKDGSILLQLKRDPCGKIPWGFTFRYDVGEDGRDEGDVVGACVVTSIDPCTPAMVGSYVGIPVEEKDRATCPLCVNDMLLVVNGREVGGMTELELELELLNCGQYLVLGIAKYNLRDQMKAQIFEVDRKVLQSLDSDVGNDRYLIEWQEIGMGDYDECKILEQQHLQHQHQHEEKEYTSYRRLDSNVTRNNNSTTTTTDTAYLTATTAAVEPSDDKGEGRKSNEVLMTPCSNKLSVSSSAFIATHSSHDGDNKAVEPVTTTTKLCFANDSSTTITPTTVNWKLPPQKQAIPMKINNTGAVTETNEMLETSSKLSTTATTTVSSRDRLVRPTLPFPRSNAATFVHDTGATSYNDELSKFESSSSLLSSASYYTTPSHPAATTTTTTTNDDDDNNLNDDYLDENDNNTNKNLDDDGDESQLAKRNCCNDQTISEQSSPVNSIQLLPNNNLTEGANQATKTKTVLSKLLSSQSRNTKTLSKQSSSNNLSDDNKDGGDKIAKLNMKNNQSLVDEMQYESQNAFTGIPSLSSRTIMRASRNDNNDKAGIDAINGGRKGTTGTSSSTTWDSGQDSASAVVTATVADDGDDTTGHRDRLKNSTVAFSDKVYTPSRNTRRVVQNYQHSFSDISTAVIATKKVKIPASAVTSLTDSDAETVVDDKKCNDIDGGMIGKKSKVDKTPVTKLITTTKYLTLSELWQILDREIRLNIGNSLRCSICLSTVKNPVRTTCMHTFCQQCINRYLRVSNRELCPECNSPCTKRSLEPDREASKLSDAHKNMLRAFGLAPGAYCPEITTMTQNSDMGNTFLNEYDLDDIAADDGGSAEYDDNFNSNRARLDRLCVATTFQVEALPNCNKVGVCSNLQIEENEQIVKANFQSCCNGIDDTFEFELDDMVPNTFDGFSNMATTAISVSKKMIGNVSSFTSSNSGHYFQSTTQDVSYMSRITLPITQEVREKNRKELEQHHRQEVAHQRTLLIESNLQTGLAETSATVVEKNSSSSHTNNGSGSGSVLLSDSNLCPGIDSGKKKQNDDGDFTDFLPLNSTTTPALKTGLLENTEITAVSDDKYVHDSVAVTAAAAAATTTMNNDDITAADSSNTAETITETEGILVLKKMSTKKTTMAVVAAIPAAKDRDQKEFNSSSYENSTSLSEREVDTAKAKDHLSACADKNVYHPSKKGTRNRQKIDRRSNAEIAIKKRKDDWGEVFFPGSDRSRNNVKEQSIPTNLAISPVLERQQPHHSQTRDENKTIYRQRRRKRTSHCSPKNDEEKPDRESSLSIVEAPKLAQSAFSAEEKDATKNKLKNKSYLAANIGSHNPESKYWKINDDNNNNDNNTNIRVLRRRRGNTNHDDQVSISPKKKRRCPKNATHSFTSSSTSYNSGKNNDNEVKCEFCGESFWKGLGIAIYKKQCCERGRESSATDASVISFIDVRNAVSALTLLTGDNEVLGYYALDELEDDGS